MSGIPPELERFLEDNRRENARRIAEHNRSVGRHWQKSARTTSPHQRERRGGRESVCRYLERSP